jgi:hypothetical protein
MSDTFQTKMSINLLSPAFEMRLFRHSIGVPPTYNFHPNVYKLTESGNENVQRHRQLSVTV